MMMTPNFGSFFENSRRQAEKILSSIFAKCKVIKIHSGNLIESFGLMRLVIIDLFKLVEPETNNTENVETKKLINSRKR